MNKDKLYEKEKSILFYFLSWLIIGFCILFIGIIEVFAEEITPIEIKSQIRTIYTDGSTQWYTSANGAYGSQLYFGTGPSYSTYGIPCNFRLMVVQNIDSKYSYKYNYSMTIYTPYSTSNTWDSTKIDKNYDIKVLDDAGIIKESKCSVVNTEVINGNTGIYTTKELSCTFSVNKNYTNGYISAGYVCKGKCELSNMEPLGFIPQDSYITITNPKIEKFEDNSNVIIDQNQTIIDQNNQTNEELGNIKDQIQESNKETQEVIKDQFNDCRDSVNMVNPVGVSKTQNGITFTNEGNGVYSLTGTSTATTAFGVTNLTNYPIILENGKTYTQKIFMLEGNLNFYITTAIRKTDGTTQYDYIVNNQTRTQTFNGNITTYNIYIPSGVTLNAKFKIQLQEGNVATSYEEYGKEICSNKIDETNDKLNDLNSSLNDSNINGSLDDAGGFFNNFSTADHGGLSGIISAPLVAINQMLNKSCNPMTTNFKGKEISLPCGYQFWSKMGAIQEFLNLILGGLLCYQIIIKLFKLIEKIKNPEDDRVEVMKL